jgi:ATP-dependent Clp protease ATP-binding subunit ClpA
MFERFTDAARSVVTVAVGEAQALDHDTVAPHHLLLGLLAEDSGTGFRILHDAHLDADRVRVAIARRTPGAGTLTAEDAEALKTLGIDLDAVLKHLTESFGPDAVPHSRPRPARSRFSPGAKKTLQLALREAVRLTSHNIGSEHVLLGLLRAADGEVTAVLAEFGITADDLRAATLRTIGRAA